MSEIDRLFNWKNPYEVDETNDLFLQAMQKNIREQYRYCADYRRILDHMGFHPDNLQEYGDLKKIPFIPTLYFKHHKLFSVPENKVLIKATSSGTGGKRSQVGFNGSSLYRGLKMVLRLCGYRRLISLKPAHYIVFGYEPNRNNSAAITKTTFGQTLFAPALSRDYALKYTKEGYQLDLESLKQKFLRLSQSVFPVRTTGFPAYTYFLLKQMKEEGLSVKLPKGSIMCLGGGWKQFYAEKISKQDFYELAEEVLGIDDRHIIEFFSAVEHPIIYVDCPCHHFHVPVYSRVIIRDVDSFEPVPDGEMGLINLLTPMVDSMPLASVMTDDLGILHREKCPCGIGSPWLEIIGRVGIKDIVTCAAGAQEMLSSER